MIRATQVLAIGSAFIVSCGQPEFPRQEDSSTEQVQPAAATHNKPDTVKDSSLIPARKPEPEEKHTGQTIGRDKAIQPRMGVDQNGRPVPKDTLW